MNSMIGRHARLPKPPAAAPGTSGVEDASKSSGDDLGLPAEPRTGRGPRRYAGRVLVVDADRDVRRSIASYLRVGGWLVDEATSGPAALDRMHQVRPDVVVLEPMLPRGRAFVAAWRKDPRLPAVPLILLAGAPARLAAVDGLRARAGLAKPVDLDVLAAVLQHVAHN